MLRKSQDVECEPGLERRGFLRGAIGALASLIGFTIAGSAGTYLLSGNGVTRRERWLDVGEIAEFSRDTPQEIEFQDQQLDGWDLTAEKASAWIIKRGDGSITAFSPKCTHLGCAYHWEAQRAEPDKGEFVCPCHGSRFDSKGDVISGPAPRPLDRYRTKMEATRLWILPLDSGSRT